MCDPIQVTLLKMLPHYSQSSREKVTPSSGTSPLASYQEVPPPPQPQAHGDNSSYLLYPGDASAGQTNHPLPVRNYC